MNNSLQEKLLLLKRGYIKKLETMIPEFESLAGKISVSTLDEIYVKVHTISGTSGMYGLTDLSDFSTDFELYLKEIKGDINLYDGDVLKDKLLSYIKKIEEIVFTGDKND